MEIKLYFSTLVNLIEKVQRRFSKMFEDAFYAFQNVIAKVSVSRWLLENFKFILTFIFKKICIFFISAIMSLSYNMQVCAILFGQFFSQYITYKHRFFFSTECMAVCQALSYELFFWLGTF